MTLGSSFHGATHRIQSAFCSSGAGKDANVSDATADESLRIAKALEADPQLLQEVVAKMNPDQRRRITVAGGAYEWFGKEKVKQEVMDADVDKDTRISPRDFNSWFENAMKRQTEIRESSSPSGPVPLSALLLIALETGLPFVGFGFLDNATMILAGDAIDRSVGFYFNCTVMASAAMGNVVSGVMGMQVHGGVEKLVQKLGLPVPVLTSEQRKSQRVFFAGHIGGTVGIAIGLTLGMLPLIWIHPEEEEHVERKIFQNLDADDNGLVSAQELLKAMKPLGLSVPEGDCTAMLQKYGRKGKDGSLALSYSDFQGLCADLKAKHVM